jgi:hypothetical protein
LFFGQLCFMVAGTVSQTDRSRCDFRDRRPLSPRNCGTQSTFGKSGFSGQSRDRNPGFGNTTSKLYNLSGRKLRPVIFLRVLIGSVSETISAVLFRGFPTYVRRIDTVPIPASMGGVIRRIRRWAVREFTRDSVCLSDFPSQP